MRFAFLILLAFAGYATAAPPVVAPMAYAIADRVNACPQQPEVSFSPGKAEALVLATIHAARQDIRLAAYSFTSKPVAEALLLAHKRGVDVRVVLDKSQRSEKHTSATFLTNAGMRVNVNDRYAMHNKFMVVDRQVVQTGSFSYSKSAASRNAENVLIVCNPGLAAQYLNEWQRLWGESTPYAARY